MSKGATTQTAEVPDYLQDLYTEASRRGLEAADIPFQPYTGEMVAGFTPDQMQAMQATRGLFGQAMDLDPRSNLAALARQGTPTVQAASLLDTDIARYQDPYTEQVLEPALADIQRRQDIEQQRAQSRAIRAGAFGGSRSAILESEATRPFAEEAAQTIAGLRSAGFGQALGMAERDAARRQQAAINQANEECMWHFKLKMFEDFQYTTYGVGHHYGWHQDTHTHAYRDQTVRKVSFTLCLNDEYTGGELEICEPHPDPKKTKFHKFDKITPGTMIIFYSGLWHRVLPVKTGFRKSLVGWTLGTKFQ